MKKTLKLIDIKVKNVVFYFEKKSKATLCLYIPINIQPSIGYCIHKNIDHFQ